MGKNQSGYVLMRRGAILPQIGRREKLCGVDGEKSASAEESGKMTPQDWESPGTFVAPTGEPERWGSERAAAYALRPLSTGEVLDRTFSVYRAHFWLFAGLASLAGAFSLILNLMQLLMHHAALLHYGFRVATIETQLSGLVLLVLLLPVQAVIYAGSVYALCEVYLGRGVTAKAAIRATMGRWARYVGIAVWQGWSAVWVFFIVGVPLVILTHFLPGASSMMGRVVAGVVLLFVGLIGGGVYAVIAYIRNSLAIPAALMEQTGVRASMRRSKTLAAGTKGRIFVVLLIAFVLYVVAGAIQAPMLIVIAKSPLQEHVIAQTAALLIGFVTQTLVSPVALIGLTLVYFDQRVRMEGFDLVMLLGGAAPAVEMGLQPWPAADAPVETASGADESMRGDGQL